jgi:inorganic pyrophosphatase
MSDKWMLAELPAFTESGLLNIVIETPKGSRNKFGFDPTINAMRLKHVLPEGMLFPSDFGFIPSTQADDGDPIDVLVLLDAPAISGCVVEARLIGVIEAEQRPKDGAWERNDRLLAVATHARTHEHVHSLDDLRENLPAEIETFFQNYNRLNGGDFRVTGRGDRAAAQRAVEKAKA